MNPFRFITDDELVEMAVRPTMFFMGADGYYHRVAKEIHD